MRKWFTISIVALAALLVVSSLTFAQAPPPGAGARGQRGGGRGNAPPAPSVPHDPKDLSGVWMKGFRTLALSDTPPPFTPLGKKLFDANKPSYGPRAIPPALGNDPTGNCDPLGLIRNLLLEVSIYQMEMVPTKDRIFQFFEWAHSYRTIWTDGRALPKDPELTWNGISVGKWDGNTFVVDSVGFDDRTWLDHFGVPHSDEMRLQERYRRIDRDNMELTVTLTDPKIFTSPWESEKKNYRLVQKRELPELFCVPSEEAEFNKIIRNPAGGVK